MDHQLWVIREDLCEKDILHKIMNEWSVFSCRYGIIKLRHIKKES